MNKIFLLVCISLIVSCHPKKQAAHNIITQKISNADSLWRAELHYYDTITSSGFIIMHKIIDSNHYQILWGKQNNLKTYKETFEAYSDASIPKLKTETKNFLILRYGCGNPCWGCVTLPKDSLFKPQDMMYDMGYNSENDLLAYWNYEKKGLTITVRSLKTEKEKDFLLCDTCFSAASIYCLNSVKLYSNKIYFKWNSTRNDSIHIKEKLFKFNL